MMKLASYFMFLAFCSFNLDTVVAPISDFRSLILRKATVTLNLGDLLNIFKNPSGDGKQNNPADIVLAACAALAPKGWVSAVSHGCHSRIPCTTICARATPMIKKANNGEGARSASCFNALHFNHGALSPAKKGKVHMTMYKYNACHETYCGPNFCCCKL